MRVSSFGYLIKEGLKNVWNNRIMSIASVCVLISCLVLTGSAVLFSMNVSQVVEKVSQRNETTVYLKDSVSSAEAPFLRVELMKIKNIASADFYSRDEAFKEYKSKLGDEVFAYLEGQDVLPDAYKITMKDVKKYDDTVKQIMKLEQVQKVSDHREFARKLASINRLVQILSIAVVIALGVISLFIISNTIRATMYSRRFEISIMKSVGATNSFVRIPFIVEGMVIGLIAAVLSTAGLAFLYDGILHIVSNVTHVDGIPLADIIWYVAGAFGVSGLLIGMLSGFISIRKYLKKEGNEILGW